MSIEIKETFQVAAPIEHVWQFMMTPANVVSCMPGASLGEILGDDRFVGSVKLKIGAVTAQYQGTITYQERDVANYKVTLLAEGNERGGGTVAGTIVTQLVALSNDSTEVRCQSSLDLTGRIIQVGRGMIEGVSAQIIKKYVANIRSLLEVPRTAAMQEGASAGAIAIGTAPAATTSKEDSINVLAVVWKVIMAGIARFFSRLFRRS